MFSRNEIEITLNDSEKIIKDHPEYIKKDIKEVLTYLEKEDFQASESQGVAAWIVIKSINDWDIRNVVAKLSSIESHWFMDQYIGFILQDRFQMDLGELLIEAEVQGQYDRVIKFIDPNWQFKTSLNADNVLGVLDVLEKHIDHNEYNRYIRNYADHISDCGSCGKVFKILQTVERKVYYDLMFQMRWAWYDKEKESAVAAIDSLAESSNIWAKKAFLDFLEVSISHEQEQFEKHFISVERIMQEDVELWRYALAALIEYHVSVNIKQIPIAQCVQNHLEQIPKSDEETRKRYMKLLTWGDKENEKLDEIYFLILEYPFCKFPFESFNFYLYKKIEKGHWDGALCLMSKVFAVNRYGVNFHDFFNSMETACSALKKFQALVTASAFRYVLKSDVNFMFFGLGLLCELGDVKQVVLKQKNGDSVLPSLFSIKHMVRTMKAMAFWAVDAAKTCELAFELLELTVLSEEEVSEYFSFCVNVLFENYPATMVDIANRYKMDVVSCKKDLAKLILEQDEISKEEKKRALGIRDLYPSTERMYIYQKAKAQTVKGIREKAQKQSPWGLIGKTSMMKYGVRSAHVVYGYKGVKSFHSTPYHKFSQAYELPVTYIIDPVKYEDERVEFLDEVISNEIDY